MTLKSTSSDEENLIETLEDIENRGDTLVAIIPDVLERRVNWEGETRLFDVVVYKIVYRSGEAEPEEE